MLLDSTEGLIMEGHQDFYDDEIAPELLRLCQKCEAKGIPFIALVQEANGSVCRTVFVPETSNPAMRLAYLAGITRGNFDVFAEYVKRDARKNGHNSTAIRILLEGPPLAPISEG